jgi:hypothetical protein
MVHQEWIKPRKFVGLLCLEYAVGEKRRCQDCRNGQAKLRRQVKQMEADGQTDIRDFIITEDASRYAFTLTTTSPAFRQHFKVLDFPSA